MNSRRYDIVRKDDKSAIWLEAASDLSTAESRIAELELCWPGVSVRRLCGSNRLDSGNPKIRFGPSRETTSAWRNTTISTKASRSNWSRLQRITKRMTSRCAWPICPAMIRAHAC
jgi:hypothetical protein